MKERAILLVEDNPDDVDLTLRAFQTHRICNNVVVVNDGVEALDFLFAAGAYAERDSRDLPAVVLLDLKLPKLNGFDVLARLRERPGTALLPVVILTSSKEEEDIVRGYKLGANSYVRKPVDFQQFSNAIRELGIYWMLINEPPPAQ